MSLHLDSPMPSRISTVLRRWQSWAGIASCIAFLHVIGWGVGTQVFGVGLGLVAYLLGVRHAFDADHIAAIDNTTRKLVNDGRGSSSVGFWFSLGHSTVVFLLAALIAFGVRTIAQPLLSANSQLHQLAGITGTVVSSGFLYIIAVVNFAVLIDIWRNMHREHSAPPGIMGRVLWPLMNIVRRPSHMYIVGFLFGLGFDTATEIGLLAATTSSVSSGYPWYGVLCLPILFAAGMSLFDSLDGSLMSSAYRWALHKPVRRRYYNLILTALSVLVAAVVGTIEIAGLTGF
jgi:nickel/cobalt transporter (NiCoT) family protein